ncbi:hypothetical protein F4802DRAFT_405687 [Xylaria palmicola]|nr:hypothetical protein F4802DRAFT_405687 [Xylaria palmicola]
MRPQILLFPISIVLAAKAPRTQHFLGAGQTSFTNVLATCPTGFETCEDGCMPVGNTCCNDGTGEACDAGYNCIPNSCCPKGEACDDDDSDTDSGTCGDGEVSCGDGYCMPFTGTCCSNDGYYCPDFGTCTGDGLCCNVGVECNSSESSLDATPTVSVPPTLSSTSLHKTDASPTPTFTAEATDNSDDDDFTLSSATTSDDGGALEPTATSVVVTVTATPSPMPPISGQAGGISGSNGRVAAGVVLVVALLT